MPVLVGTFECINACAGRNIIIVMVSVRALTYKRAYAFFCITVSLHVSLSMHYHEHSLRSFVYAVSSSCMHMHSVCWSLSSHPLLDVLQDEQSSSYLTAFADFFICLSSINLFKNVVTPDFSFEKHPY
ncbi:hypothetical protein NE237_015216 [Protea cynaroides]|uniref:Uncharacterized protein n=1 Tax=Protea cynaroides TaxID=273540 RepID=A0A9Q0QQQ4_9MAGN|nr:hypothetical protein NE237_015216 [Protea cynaroides]